MRPNKTSPYLLLRNIRQLLGLRGEAGPRRRHALGEIGLIEDAAVLCAGGKIVAAGRERDVLRDPWLRKHRRGIKELDCRRGVVLPGFVDSHTHPAFAAPRLIDFEKRIAGASYQEIAEAGGGIRSSARAVQAASRQQLASSVLEHLGVMLRHGTTTVEAKSGYGLSPEAEIKSLEAIRDASRRWPGTTVPTYLAAHALPSEFAGREDDYVDQVCAQMIPMVANKKLAQYVDVFCERGAFTVAQSEKIFSAAQKHGLGARAHVCQFTPSKLEGLLAYQPASLDHMDCLSQQDVPLLARSSAVVTLLPCATHFLAHRDFPDARRLIDSGAAVALATDFNPGTAPTPSMAFAISVACTHMKMTPAEAIVAGTLNGAAALRLEKTKGSIEPGKDADLCVFDVDDYREIPYWLGWNRCVEVVVSGESAWSRAQF